MNARLLSALPLCLGLACGSSPRQPLAEMPGPVVAPAPEADEDGEPSSDPGDSDPKQGAEAEKLAREFADMESKAKAELDRWTPELRAEAKKLADATYMSARAGVMLALKGKHRTPGHSERDAARHPLATLEFFGLTPTMTVLEHGPGEGWYTELLAPTLAKRGKLLVTMADPKAPREVRATLYAQRLERFLDKSPELYGKVERVIVDGRKPALSLEGAVDMVLVIRAMHGWQRDKTLGAWLGEYHKALKPGGTLGIVQHRAKDGTNPDETAPKGYLPEKFVIEQVEAAGFKLAKKSEVNANPKDTTEHPEGVWSLPPTLRGSESDQAKYKAIGESDRMTLRFTKVGK